MTCLRSGCSRSTGGQGLSVPGVGEGISASTPSNHAAGLGHATHRWTYFPKWSTWMGPVGLALGKRWLLIVRGVCAEAFGHTCWTVTQRGCIRVRVCGGPCGSAVGCAPGAWPLTKHWSTPGCGRGDFIYTIFLALLRCVVYNRSLRLLGRLRLRFRLGPGHLLRW